MDVNISMQVVNGSKAFIAVTSMRMTLAFHTRLMPDHDGSPAYINLRIRPHHGTLFINYFPGVYALFMSSVEQLL